MVQGHGMSRVGFQLMGSERIVILLLRYLPRYHDVIRAQGQLGRQGVTRETLKPGDHVVIAGNPGRNPDDHRLRMIRLKRTSDGWTWGGRPGESFD